MTLGVTFVDGSDVPNSRLSCFAVSGLNLQISFEVELHRQLFLLRSKTCCCYTGEPTTFGTLDLEILSFR